MKRCLIYLDDTEIQNSIDLLEVARQIYFEEVYETVGVAVNFEDEQLSGLFDRIIQVNNPVVNNYDQVAISKIMEELHRINGFDSILVPATYFGRMLAPRLAMILKTGLVADVTAIRHDGGVLEIIRPAFSGRIMAGITSVSNGPVMMSVRQNIFHYDIKEHKPTQYEIVATESVKDGGIRCVAIKDKKQAYDIRESKVLISGGRGIIRNFHKVEKLAHKLDGQVSASRKIVDKGLASRSIQVGQSGKTVSPKLYIALGIHGAMQHVEGLKQVEHIISVNINKEAPICSLSDIVVEGDAVAFVDKLVEKIE